MIPKASQRGGGQQLATHLLNAHDNERVEIIDMRGSVARDLHGAFAEWRAASTATNCRKYIYSLSFNPDPQQRRLTREEITDYIARAEQRLGLENQPRAIVIHEKYGREHVHVAWSRIDIENIRAIQLSHDRHKLRAVTQEFAREKGLRLPDRMKDGRDRFKDRDSRVTHAEKQQEERTGITKEERRRELTALWRQADNAESFTAALEDKGYFLAQGDKRSFVVVDRYGEIHSLGRQLDGVKTKDIRARLPPPYKLRTVADAKTAAMRKFAPPVREQFRAQADTRRADLAAAQKKRRAKIIAKMDTLAEKHERELRQLAEKHAAANAPSPPAKGLAAFLGRITGIEARRKKKHALRLAAQDKTVAAKKQQQAREIRDFMRQLRALDKIDRREIKSLLTTIRREERLRERQAEIARKRTVLTKEFRENIQDIAAAMSEQKKERQESKGRAEGDTGTEQIRPEFNKAAKGIPKEVADKIREAAARKRPGRGRDRDRPR
ncbi:MAG: relaxase/mobilization nuclease domain-containing protein [Nitrospiraceae bacterium]